MTGCIQVRRLLCFPMPNKSSIKEGIHTVFVSQLNGSMVGDVHVKVSIARKQPMLDAATGKSVWASLGKHTALYRLFSH